MECLRCGRKVQERQVFCPECLEEMEHYPVKPTVIRLPVRPKEPPKAKPAKEPQAEEQLAVARQKLQKLRRITAPLAVALALSMAALCWLLLPDPPEQDQPAPRNFTTDRG